METGCLTMRAGGLGGGLCTIEESKRKHFPFRRLVRPPVPLKGHNASRWASEADRINRFVKVIAQIKNATTTESLGTCA
jgi:hypothetical protein